MSILTSAIKKTLGLAGYDLQKRSFEIPIAGTMLGGLETMKKLGIEPEMVIDIGAAQGTWTQKCLKVWPKAKYELIEPLVEQAAFLQALNAGSSQFTHHLAVAGSSEGEILFNVSDDLDGSGVYGDAGDNARMVKVIAVDQIITPNLNSVVVKLDTHGYEVAIIEGMKKSLDKISLLIIEVYGFKISPTCLRFHELTAYLEKMGFRLVDIADILRRPGDQAFWQADAFYLKSDHPVFDKETYV